MIESNIWNEFKLKYPSFEIGVFNYIVRTLIEVLKLGSIICRGHQDSSDFPKPSWMIEIENKNAFNSIDQELKRILRREFLDDQHLQNIDDGSGDGSGEDFPLIFETFPTISQFTTTTTTTTTTPKPKQEPDLSCIAQKECFHDSECPTGKCLGSELGLCDCNACINALECASDEDCGGLRNSCVDGRCDCVMAFQTHGYDLFVKVILNFCHQTRCSSTSDNCFGLPCKIGKCACNVQHSKQPVHYFTG
ncbi:unnamed protein product [Caenorhabditis bovis]|uniref:Uncharacterized protein n=1 Tax=Caenorhabditis bovis TaxID=2654633 RepID=A0A8S1EIW9_9PELO|nr:unnamed protein product [Caenorhabditis bovis]